MGKRKKVKESKSEKEDQQLQSRIEGRELEENQKFQY
jgi:hypothetical protein